MPLIIGLAGTIAAGKSTVGQLIVEHGAVHCDADKLVHKLYDPGTPGFEKVVAEFGQEVVGPDGYVDRKILGAKVFGKPEEMAKLTRAMGSISEAIKGVIDQWRIDLGPNDIGVMEAVNLMEPGYGNWCDQVWLIAVDDAVAKQRLLETRGMTEAEADQRIGAMVKAEVRAPGADCVYFNNGTRDDLQGAVDGELARIRKLHETGDLPKSVFTPWWEKFVESRRELLKQAGATLADEKK